MTEPGPMPHRPSETPKLLRALSGGDDEQPLPVINAGDRNLPRISKAALEALVAANDPPRMFHYGGMVSRVECDEQGVPILRPMTDERTRHELARAAMFITYDKNRVAHDALPPSWLVKDLLATPALPLPALTRIVEVPTFAPDGSLNETPGYSANAQTYYAPAPGFALAPIPEHPTADQIAECRDFLTHDLLGGFPFVDTADLANAVALFLDPFVRDMIDGQTPLRAIDAPTAGSGKSLLASILLSPAIGRNPSVMFAPRQEDEWRKRIFATLRMSPASVVIDNVAHTLDSASLAGALTTAYVEDRVLGISEIVRVPNRCAWVVTANNITMSTEIARRTTRIRVDPKIDRPWQRTGFVHEDLRSWAHQQRRKLVWCGLVLVRAWIIAGQPSGARSLGSYERWSAVLGGILDVAGIPDFLGNLEQLYEEADAEGTMLRDFVSAWAEKFGSQEVGVTELFDVANGVEGFDFGKGGDRAQRTVFGKRLGKMRDRVIGSYRIVHTRSVHRANKWRLGPSQAAEESPGVYVHDVNVGEHSGHPKSNSVSITPEFWPEEEPDL